MRWSSWRGFSTDGWARIGGLAAIRAAWQGCVPFSTMLSLFARLLSLLAGLLFALRCAARRLLSLLAAMLSCYLPDSLLAFSSFLVLHIDYCSVSRLAPQLSLLLVSHSWIVILTVSLSLSLASLVLMRFLGWQTSSNSRRGEGVGTWVVILTLSPSQSLYHLWSGCDS